MTVPLVLRNADIWTMQRSFDDRAAALLVRDGRIVAVGDEASVRSAAGTRYDDLDCAGGTILPAFIDSHLHLFAWAASLLTVDCSPRAVRSIPELTAAIAARARTLLPGDWLRAAGYRETELAERRHPTRWELDAAAPHNPVRLDHGSGHGCVLNSAALAAAGLSTETEEPSGAFISRRLDDGEPDGPLLEMNGWLNGRIPCLPEAELRQGVAEASRRLLAAGITAAVDLGAHNDRSTQELLWQFERDGVLCVPVVAAIGYDAFQRGERPQRSGLVKLVVNELGGELRPSLEDLSAAILAVDAAGLRAAIHCVSAIALDHALTAFERVLPQQPHHRRRHRIEHAAVCPPSLTRRMHRARLHAVMNPGMIPHNGDRFLRDVPPADLPWLHNPQTLISAGGLVAAASDAPVTPPDPLAGIRAMVERRTASGARIPGATTSLPQAVAAHTIGASGAVAGLASNGQLVPGGRADLLRLPRGWDREGSCGEGVRPRTMLAGRWVDA